MKRLSMGLIFILTLAVFALAGATYAQARQATRS